MPLELTDIADVKKLGDCYIISAQPLAGAVVLLVEQVETHEHYEVTIRGIVQAPIGVQVVVNPGVLITAQAVAP